MESRTQLIGFIISSSFLAVVLLLVYKRRLREEYSLLWLLGASFLLGLSILNKVLVRAAEFLGIDYAPSLLFTVSALFGLIIMLSHAVVITTLVRRNRDLAQKIALLDWHIDQIEQGLGATSGKNGKAIGEKARQEEFHHIITDRELVK